MLVSFGTISQKHRKRGKDSEKRVFKVLKRMKELGEVDNYSDVAKDPTFFRSGVDAFIRTNDKCWPLQIKSSQKGIEKHKKIYPDIEAVNGQSDYQSIRERIKKLGSNPFRKQ